MCFSFFKRSPPVTQKDIEKIWRELAYMRQSDVTILKEIDMASAAIQADVQAILDTISTVKSDFDSAFAKLQADEDADVIAAFQPVADKLAALDAAAKNQPAPPFQTNPDQSTGAESPPADVTPSPDVAPSASGDVSSTPPDNTTAETPTT